MQKTKYAFELKAEACLITFWPVGCSSCEKTLAVNTFSSHTILCLGLTITPLLITSSSLVERNQLLVGCLTKLGLCGGTQKYAAGVTGQDWQSALRE
jgi:hypothetical protein